MFRYIGLSWRQDFKKKIVSYVCILSLLVFIAHLVSKRKECLLPWYVSLVEHEESIYRSDRVLPILMSSHRNLNKKNSINGYKSVCSQ